MMIAGAGFAMMAQALALRRMGLPRDHFSEMYPFGRHQARWDTLTTEYYRIIDNASEGWRIHCAGVAGNKWTVPRVKL